MTKHYVDNNKFLYQIILCQGKGQRSPELDKIFLDICIKFMLRFYTNKEIQQDQIHSAFIKCCNIYKGYDCSRKNVLAYFTEVIKREVTREYNVQFSISNRGDGKYKREFEYVQLGGNL